MKTYRFEVPCWYVYNIKAKSEKQARKILVKEGGLEIDGELCEMDERDYKKAKLIEVEMKGIKHEKEYKEHS